ncbi:hypothetical protein CCHR01_06964 [Colletotrichum chrysophilum]|uniref:Uncharacterized protein n=1 Tax=Colletotrichum chrysophilum TaxID=1836956 RepID=A0AAD9ANV3_9PEZI|nr:hypothetical protein CCHR01_06964 [Colletotrichum chrysophilum]
MGRSVRQQRPADPAPSQGPPEGRRRSLNRRTSASRHLRDPDLHRGGPPGSASVFFCSCLALHRHFHSAASFLGKTDKRVRNKTPTASVSLNPPCRPRRCGAWHAVESSS